jgi:tetratricopeptide (TPR) repeat protein
MPEDIPPKARSYLQEAVTILQEDVAHSRAYRATDQVLGNLQKAVDEYPEYFEAWRLMGEVYLGTEQSLRGFLALKRAHELKEDDVGVATLLGEAALILDRPALALGYLERASEAEEPPLAARKLLALALAKAERWEESLRAFGEALAEDPSDGNIRRECARVLLDLDFNEEAASVLADYLDPFRDFVDSQHAILDSGMLMPPSKVLDRLSPGARKTAAGRETVARPEDYRAWYAFGNTFLDSEHYEAAAACYRRALRIHPDYYDALHNMGIALEELGRLEEAFQMYEAAMEADPESAEAYLSMAELLEDLSPEETDEIAVNYLMYYRLEPDAEGFQELEEELRERLEISPDIALVQLLAHVYLLREEVGKAEEMLAKLESAGSEEAAVLWLKGRTLRELGRVREAEEAFRAGLENADTSSQEDTIEEEDIEAKLRCDLAALLAEEGRPSEAREVLLDDPEGLDADGLSLLAELMLEENPDEAESIWRQALELDAEHPDALIGLGERMIELGRIEDAIVLLEQALKSDPDDERLVRRLAELYPKIGAPELSPALPGQEEGPRSDGEM